MGPKVCDILDSVGTLWTSIDVVRFAKVREKEPVDPVVLWIGVAPETLFGEDAHTAAHGCLGLLKEFGITDVEVEYRESMYTQLAGPDLLKPACMLHPTVDVRGPHTPALGLFIAAQTTPHIECTGATLPKAATARRSCSSRLAMSSSHQTRGLMSTTLVQTPASLVEMSSFSAPRRSTSSLNPSRARSKNTAKWPSSTADRLRGRRRGSLASLTLGRGVSGYWTGPTRRSQPLTSSTTKS